MIPVGLERGWSEIEKLCAVLLVDVAEGSQSAMAEVYDRTSRLVYGFALKITGDHCASEDITIEVYLQVWRKAHTYDPARGTVAGWLFTLTRSRAIDWLRSRKRSRESSSECGLDLPDSRPGPDDGILQGERASLIHAALNELAPERRELIELAYSFGLSHSEIANLTRLPLGTVKTRIRQGLLHLRELLIAQAAAPRLAMNKARDST